MRQDKTDGIEILVNPLIIPNTANVTVAETIARIIQQNNIIKAIFFL